uniref:Alanine aminotransferase n=1 Tax=Pseudokeronopsis rubra TaxID=390142 RepID=A0A1B0RYF6_9SPIT|nr:alanine aminotransferase [Pseudokeronopsis rubra]
MGNQRDSIGDSSAHNIYLTNGASEGVRQVLNMAIRSKEDGIMVPIPQYPLYSALITLQGGTMVPYYLDEPKNWGLDIKDLEYRVKKAKDEGLNVRSMVVINPGNPTGQVLTEQNIREIILCYENSILIMADEVYKNVYSEGSQFLSFRKVLNGMGAPYKDNELISFHSISKGLMGECGLRGGYMETHNIDPFVEEMFYKLKSIELCSNTIGQLGTLLMINPPKRGVEADEVVDLYEKEQGEIYGGLKERAKMLTATFNKMERTSCSEIQGAMYGFPRIHLTQSAIKAAKEQGVQPDFFYCMQMVNETGIMTVPGSGFGQRDGEFHYRITNLVSPTSEMRATLDRLEAFNSEFYAKYSQ